MNELRQVIAVTTLNLRSLPSRFWPSMVIVVGMACVIGVLLSMLSLTAGYSTAQLRAGDPMKAIVLGAGSDDEQGGSIPRNAIPPILDSPGVAKDPDGSSVGDGEDLQIIHVIRKANGKSSILIVRGITRKGLEMRPELKIIAGRMYRPGGREFIVGEAARDSFVHLDVGDLVSLPDGAWPIVGVYSADGDYLEGQLLADVDTMWPAMRSRFFDNVLVKLARPDSLAEFKHAVESNPALSVTVMRHSDYVAHVAGRDSRFFNAIAFAVGGIMAIGAVFGALNTMYAAVGARSWEIATLRALGFSGLAVAVSVLAEALVLALAGALLGTAIAWAVFNGQEYSFGTSVFNLAMTPQMVGLGIGWALAVACLGGLLPAIRAARLPIVEALRAT